MSKITSKKLIVVRMTHVLRPDGSVIQVCEIDAGKFRIEGLVQSECHSVEELKSIAEGLSKLVKELDLKVVDTSPNPE